MQSELKTLGHAETTATDLAIRFGPKLLAAILIIVGGLLVARWVGRASERAFKGMQLEPPVRLLLVRVIRIFVLGLFLILALQNLGVELLPLVAGLGVAGAGVALAMQGVLGNAVAGLTIIFTKPYRVGESIAIVGVEGTVESITLFSTVLRHSDRSSVVVPNRKIVGEIIFNYGAERRVPLTVEVAYREDLDKALRTVHEVLAANPRVIQGRSPQVGITKLGDSGIEITMRPWCKAEDFWEVHFEIYRAIVDRFRTLQVEIPYPQREVRLLNAPV